MSVCSVRTLWKLLGNGLILKRDQAQIALQLNASNRWDVRQRLFHLGGRQNRYKRLDRHGMQRAEEISRLQRRIFPCQNGTKKRLLTEKLKRLKKEHQLENLECNCTQMSSDIRRLLNEGASFKPLESKSKQSRLCGSSATLEMMQRRVSSSYPPGCF